MKKLTTLILIALVATLNLSAETKVAVIDMERIFDGYKKVQNIETKMKGEIEQTANALDSKRQEGVALLKKMEELLKKQKNPALSQEARDAAKAEARQIEDLLEKKRESFEKDSLAARQDLAKKEEQHRQAIYQEVQRAAIAIANKEGATIILDKSAKGTAGFSVLLYAEDAVDLTAPVLRLLNAGK